MPEPQSKLSRPKTEKRPATSVAYEEHTGAYHSLPWHDAIARLYAWAKERKVMPGFYPMGVYMDDPRQVPEARRRTRIAITFKGKAKPKPPIQTAKLPAMRLAAVSFKGQASGFAGAYAELQAWIGERGLRIVGPPMEIYTKKPVEEAGQTVMFAKIVFPVAEAPAKKGTPRRGT